MKLGGVVKRVPEEGLNEIVEEEECRNGCSKHANEGVCVLLLLSY